MVVEKADPKPETATKQEPVDDDVDVIENPEDQLQVGVMKGRATFDELMIWGHESTSDSSTDPYVRGMEEWIAFAEEVRSQTYQPNLNSHVLTFPRYTCQVRSRTRQSKVTTESHANDAFSSDYWEFWSLAVILWKVAFNFMTSVKLLHLF